MQYDQQYFDEKNRPVKEVFTEEGSEKYYLGSDAEGVIKEDEEGNEYIEVDGERRYWRGKIEPIPDDSRLDEIPKFSFGFLKPDAKQRNLRREILLEIRNKAEIESHKSFQFDPELVYKMYPHFFEKSWEQALLKYLCSNTSLAFLAFGNCICERMNAVRDRIRKKYQKPDLHPVVNLIHVADSREDSLRECLLVYDIDELVDIAHQAH